CGLGSVKANIGHATMAAGVASLLKVILALEHRQLPPLANFTSANPTVDFVDAPFRVLTEATEWAPAGGGRRLAGVSSFGFSGTNCHVVVAEAPDLPARPPTGGPVVVPISARTEDRLRQCIVNLVEHFEAHRDTDVVDIAYTLAVGRTHFRERAAVVATDRDDLVRKLRALLTGDE